MFKLTALVCVMLVGMLHTSKASCDSCGTECAPSCGTRRFRTCCFNYLRKKRGPDSAEFWALQTQEGSGIPVVFVKYTPEDWSDILARDSKASDNQDTAENRLINA